MFRMIEKPGAIIGYVDPFAREAPLARAEPEPARSIAPRLAAAPGG